MAVISGWKRITYTDGVDTWTEVLPDAKRHAPYSTSITVVSTDYAPDLTVDEMLAWMVSKAENDNYHEWVDLYEQLYGLVKKHGGKAAADGFITEVFEMGGLHGR